MEINWTNDLNNPVYKDALKLRLSVFVDELKGSLDVEISDEDGCIYSVVYEDDIPISTGRIYSVSKQLARLQRIAVKKEYRNRGYGKILIDSLEKKCKAYGIDTIEVCASINALSFYQDMGYLVQGDFFTRDNIQHVFVVKEI